MQQQLWQNLSFRLLYRMFGQKYDDEGTDDCFSRQLICLFLYGLISQVFV